MLVATYLPQVGGQCWIPYQPHSKIQADGASSHPGSKHLLNGPNVFILESVFSPQYGSVEDGVTQDGQDTNVHHRRVERPNHKDSRNLFSIFQLPVTSCVT